MKTIVVHTIPGSDQRYPTCGDYWENETEIHVRITKQINEDYEFLILIHELIEFWLTKKRGIKEEEITNYDIKWEEKKNSGQTDWDEPGNEPHCIYEKEHRFAENVERQIALEMGINWFTYDKYLTV